MVEFIIDPEFRDKIPAMPKEDFDGLRADIIRDGYVRDPLVVWKEENILLDGHHRWKVIQENRETLGDKFNVVYMSFPDRWAAIAWICANQLHKHNMNPIQRDKLIQEEHDAKQKTQGGTGANQYTARKEQSGEFVHSAKDVPGGNKTRAAIAGEHRIPIGAVKIAVEVGRGIDRAAKVDPEFKREVLSGKVKARKSDLAAIRKIENDEEVKKAIEVIRDPSKKREGNWATKETRKCYERIREISEQMGEGANETTFDDVFRILDSFKNNFLAGIERTITSERGKLVTDEQWPNAIGGYFDSIIADINELKGRIIK